jgi:hypothetical protein
MSGVAVVAPPSGPARLQTGDQRPAPAAARSCDQLGHGPVPLRQDWGCRNEPGALRLQVNSHRNFWAGGTHRHVPQYALNKKYIKVSLLYFMT